MGDNGKETIIGEQKQSEDKVIFTAIMKPDNSIQVQLFSDFVPMVCYAQKLLDMIVTGKIAQQQMKAQAQKPIITPPKGGIFNFIRGRR